jgi:mono/diheme cytochrome c family protein
MTALHDAGRHRRTGFAHQPQGARMFRLRQSNVLCGALWSFAAAAGGLPAGEVPDGAGSYVVLDGKADARTFNGFRRYHAGCNHCHGPDGLGSTFSPSLLERLPDLETFRRIVLHGRTEGTFVMRGFAGDPNFAPYVDDIYAYLRARADGALGRGRPGRLEP